jgi:hypothetical protein
MHMRDDVAAAESMPSPFEKKLCDHKQVTQDIFMVKEGDSKNRRGQLSSLGDVTSIPCEIESRVVISSS